MWKDFFHFPREQRQGIIILITLIGLVIGIGYMLSGYRQAEWMNDSDGFLEEYHYFLHSLKESDSIKASGRRSSYGPYTNRNSENPVTLTRFDPNMADSTTFCQMGLPAWIARNIIRYREKGGKFRSPEDFRKIYGLSEDQYQTLLPYIYINKEHFRKDTTTFSIDRIETADTDTLRPFKYATGTRISLNTADTTELKKIPGIGSGIAKRIVNYRNTLGGFYHISQLEEINLNVDILTEWFNIEEGETKCINLNKVSVERLRSHPYFNFYQARIIVEYRKKKGFLKHLNQLAFYDEFTDKDMERLKYYVCFD